jgi:hypothetical protein
VLGVKQWLRDFIVLARCVRLAVGLPSAILFAYRTLNDLIEVFDLIVTPVVDCRISDPSNCVQVRNSLRAMSIKIGYAVLSFARMAGRGRPIEVAALAGAVTRLYDDLIDGDADRLLDDRLTELFKLRPFASGSDLERLLAELYYGIAHRIQPTNMAVFESLQALHDYQCLSRQQRETGIALDTLEKITSGKGAMANLTLCGLVKSKMDPGERELVMALGEAFQALDDYMDVEFDRQNGVNTPASVGSVTLEDVGRRMQTLRPRLVHQYGRVPARQYCGMIYILLLKSVMGRRLPFIGRLAQRVAGRSQIVTVLTRGDGVLAPAAPVAGLRQEKGEE